MTDGHASDSTKEESVHPVDTFPSCRFCEGDAADEVNKAVSHEESAEHTGHDHAEHERAEQEGRIPRPHHERAADELSVSNVTPTTGRSHREHGEHVHDGHGGHDSHGGHDGHGAHTDHSGHEQMFRRRFWVSLVLSIPVIVFSEFIQDVFGYTAPAFPGSTWITPVLAVVIFAYGGVPFLSMARTELQNREPGMMMLISLAITVAFVYSIASLFLEGTTPFFWELVTLIDIMLLGHWMEMRSVRQASGAPDELAKLMPDTAERVTESGEIKEVPVSELTEGDVLLVRPGASVPADGEVVEGESSVDESMITGESRPVDKEPGAEVIAGTVNQAGVCVSK